MARIATSAAHLCQRLQELYPHKLQLASKQVHHNHNVNTFTKPIFYIVSLYVNVNTANSKMSVISKTVCGRPISHHIRFILQLQPGEINMERKVTVCPASFAADEVSL